MLRIRLRRVGKKGKPSYRIVVADSRAPRDGAYLEWIGNYDPMADPPTITLKEDRAIQWLSKGAQPSDAVARILDKNGIFERTEQLRTTTPKSADDASSGATSPVASTVPTVVTVVETSSPVEATAAEAAIDEAPADEQAVESPAEEESDEPSEGDAPVDEITAEAPAEEEPDEDSDAEAPVDEITAEATAQDESDEASQE